MVITTVKEVLARIVGKTIEHTFYKFRDDHLIVNISFKDGSILRMECPHVTVFQYEEDDE